MAGLSSAVPYIGPALTAAGTLTSFFGNRDAGKAARQNAEYEAAQLEQNAGQATAAAQRQAMEERRKSRFAQSRALAIAAASGAGASDPTVTDIIGDLAQEGAYRGMLDIYEGEDKARLLRQNAASKRYTGEATGRAYDTYATTSLLRGGASLFAKYAFGKSPSGGTTPTPFFDAGTPLNSPYG